jgi:hypothetical protein
MKNFLQRATSLLLVVAFLALIASSTLNNSTAASGLSSVSTTVANPDNQKKASVLTGENAKLHIKALRAQNKAVNRAVKDMEKMGRQIDWEHSTVLYTVDPSQAKNSSRADTKFRKASFAPETMSNADGEMTFVSYYGPDNYWDGTVYVTDYNTGATDVYNSTVDGYGSLEFNETSQEVYEVYYPPDGGPPQYEGGGGPGGGCGDGPCILEGPVAKLYKNNKLKKVDHSEAAHATRVIPVGFFGWLSRFFRCLGRATVYFAERCVSPSPSFRNNLICAVVGAFQAAGCCAAYNGRSRGPLNPNNTGPGGGYCYR